MQRQVVLLRGINVGPNNRVAMPALRGALMDAGLDRVKTYVQSGNIVADSELEAAALADLIERLLAERFGVSTQALARPGSELAEAVTANPFPDLATQDPKHFQVTFLSELPDASALREAEAFAAQTGEAFAARGRELYAHHPAGIHLSKLVPRLTAKRLGVTVATARNWSTVNALLEMASTDAA